MGNRGPRDERAKEVRREQPRTCCLPLPTSSYRRRAWVKFQRALDPLAPIKPLPPRRP